MSRAKLRERLPWDKPARVAHTHPQVDNSCDVLNIEGHLGAVHGWHIDGLDHDVSATVLHEVHNRIHREQDPAGG